MKQVKIISGVSGSGKSSLTMKVIGALMPLTNTYMSGHVVQVALCSADSFFEKDGVYTFNPVLLNEAHGKCFRDFITALSTNVEIVVVDNTNTSVAEVAPYFLGAQAYGYDVDMTTIMCKTDADVKLCAARNTHNVPEGGIFAQHRRLCERELMPWWKNTFQSVVV